MDYFSNIKRQFPVTINDSVKAKRRIDNKIVFYNFDLNEYHIYEGIDVKIIESIQKRLTISQIIDLLSQELREGHDEISSYLTNFIESLIKNNIYSPCFKEKEKNHKHLSDSFQSFSLDEVFLELTKKCNLNCRHCYIDKTAFSKQLSTEGWIRIIDQLDKLDVLKIKLTGGEPMLHPYFYDIVNYIKKKKMGMRLYTNGSMLNQLNIRKIKESGIRELQISLDGFTAKTHDEFRRTNGNFEKILGSLPFLDEIGISTILSYTVTDFNIEEVRLLGDYVRKFKNIRINISPYINYQCSNDSGDRFLKVSEGTINKLKNAFFFFSDIWSQKINYGLTFSNKYIGYCGAGIFSCYITSEGDVGLCPLLNKGQFFAGSLKLEKLSNIWNYSNAFKAYRQYNVKDINKCNTCIYVNSCRGGCRARAFYMTKSLLEPDPVSCQMYK